MSLPNDTSGDKSTASDAEKSYSANLESNTIGKTFDSADRYIIVVLSCVIMFSVVVFFVFVHSQNLVKYPEDRIEHALSSDSFEYFAYALEYRERRLSLALTYRTFITTFGFTIGLILSAVGGIFILRKSIVEFDLKGNAMPGGGAAAEGIVGDGKPGTGAVSALKSASLGLATNSPGVLFMLGGISIMILTQYFAIPVGAPEIFPPSSIARCDADQMRRNECYLEGSAPSTNPQLQRVLQFCSGDPENKGCVQFEALMKAME